MGRFSQAKIDWSPFTLCALDQKAPYPRALSTPQGLGDRLRFVAFAELQAWNAFKLASEIYEDAPLKTRALWAELAIEESIHFRILMDRMNTLQVDPAERPQSLALWNSFDRCISPQQFAEFMANAEERGRVAGEQFFETLKSIDPITAEIFQKIAKDEVEHIKLAKRAFDFLLSNS
jgi:uncharacterized ferritin-like protein (DUF455 family)